jgi:hypothetical protein
VTAPFAAIRPPETGTVSVRQEIEKRACPRPANGHTFLPHTERLGIVLGAKDEPHENCTVDRDGLEGRRFLAGG